MSFTRLVGSSPAMDSLPGNGMWRNRKAAGGVVVSFAASVASRLSPFFAPEGAIKMGSTRLVLEMTDGDRSGKGLTSLNYSSGDTPPPSSRSPSSPTSLFRTRETLRRETAGKERGVSERSTKVEEGGSPTLDFSAEKQTASVACSAGATSVGQSSNATENGEDKLAKLQSITYEEIEEKFVRREKEIKGGLVKRSACFRWLRREDERWSKVDKAVRAELAAKYARYVFDIVTFIRQDPLAEPDRRYGFDILNYVGFFLMTYIGMYPRHRKSIVEHLRDVTNAFWDENLKILEQELSLDVNYSYYHFFTKALELEFQRWYSG